MLKETLIKFNLFHFDFHHSTFLLSSMLLSLHQMLFNHWNRCCQVLIEKDIDCTLLHPIIIFSMASYVNKKLKPYGLYALKETCCH